MADIGGGFQLRPEMPPDVLVQLLLQGCLVRDNPDELGHDSIQTWLEDGFPFTAAMEFTNVAGRHTGFMCRACGAAALAARAVESIAYPIEQHKDMTIAYIYDILRVHDLPYDEKAYKQWQADAKRRGVWR